MFELSDIDYGYSVFVDLDLESQLIAIKCILSKHQHAEIELSQEIELLGERARELIDPENGWVIDSQIDRMHESVYLNAAHSMAAVGMLAPLLEAIFESAFGEIGRQYFMSRDVEPSHVRYSHSSSTFWDCHFVFSKGIPRKDLVAGIIQLAEAIELRARLRMCLVADAA